MAAFRPRFITFDCYGTLTHFQMTSLTSTLFSGRVPPDRMQAFTSDFSAYRLDEVLGDWKPYAEVIKAALRRGCKRWGLPYDEAEAQQLYEAIPTWGPHPDVPAPLARVAKEFPLVILSNASDSQIHRNVEKLGAPFHAVYTAEQARAYKPRLRAFEYMIDQLGCDPGDAPARVVASPIRPHGGPRRRDPAHRLRRPGLRALHRLLWLPDAPGPRGPARPRRAGVGCRRQPTRTGVDAASSASRTSPGSWIVKTVPWPGSLSTVTSPPIIWQKRRLRTSPSPVPPYFLEVVASA